MIKTGAALRFAAGRWAPFAVGLTAFAVFVPTLGHLFVYDDVRQVLDNPWIWSPRHLPDLLFKPVWAFLDPNSTTFYRPVQTLLHFVAAMLFGRNPFGFHLVSVTMHALASMAALLLLREATGRARAFAASMLFAVWPIHAEPVAWVSAGPDVNAALFLFLTLAFWSRARDTEREAAGRWPGKSEVRAGLAGAAFFLALLSKETAVVGPLLALALPGRRETGNARAAAQADRAERVRTAWHFVVAFALPAAAYLLLRVQATGGLAPRAARAALSGGEALGTGLALLPRYLVLAFVPWRVVPDRVVLTTAGPFAAGALLGIACLAAIVAGYLVLRRRAPAASFGLALLLLPLLPALQVQYFSSSLQADRYLYIPSLGACLILAECAGWLWRRAASPFGRAVPVAALGLLAAAMAARTVAVAGIWRDSESLGRAGIALEPRSVSMRLEQIHTLDERGEIDAALGAAKEGLRLVPNDPKLSAAIAGLEARRAAATGGDPIAIYNQALAADPAQPHLWAGLSAALLRADRFQEAIAAAERALALENVNRAALVNLGTARGALRDYAGQEREARRLLAIDPDSAPGLLNLGAARLGQEDLAGGRDALLRALALDPALARAELYLSWIAARQGEPDEALRRARHASELDSGDPEIWNRLGVALASSGDREGARQAWETALALRPGDPQASANLERAGRIQSGNRSPAE